MHWSALLFMAMTGLSSSDVAVTTPSATAYTSYTQAWNAATEAKKPMLVILNPGPESGERQITEASLRSNKKLDTLLDQYVLAIVDTSTEHGQEVNRRFGSPALPRVVIIDKAQKKQIFRASGHLSGDSLVNVLEDHKEGTPKVTTSPPTTNTVISPAGSYILPSTSNCPSCQRRYTF
jgi:hypothetical protein